MNAFGCPARAKRSPFDKDSLIDIGGYAAAFTAFAAFGLAVAAASPGAQGLPGVPTQNNLQ